jgi:hypothetical protein
MSLQFGHDCTAGYLGYFKDLAVFIIYVRLVTRFGTLNV